MGRIFKNPIVKLGSYKINPKNFRIKKNESFIRLITSYENDQHMTPCYGIHNIFFGKIIKKKRRKILSLLSIHYYKFTMSNTNQAL